MLEHIPGLPDLILFWMTDMSVIRVSRCGITRGMLSGKHVLTLIWMIMTGGSFKIISNWTVLTAAGQSMSMATWDAVDCSNLSWLLFRVSCFFANHAACSFADPAAAAAAAAAAL